MLVLCLLMLGCGGEKEPSSKLEPLKVVGEPAMSNPGGVNGVLGTRVLNLKTNKVSVPQVKLVSEGSTVVFEGPAGKSHHLELIGMGLGRTHEVTVTLTDPEHKEPDLVLELPDITTGSLPDWWPEVVIREAHPRNMEPGLTLLEVSESKSDGFHSLLMLDLAGEVVWFLDTGELGFLDVRFTEEGLLTGLFSGGILSLDVLGTVHTSLSLDGANGGDEMPFAVHHEVVPLEDGFLTLGFETVSVDSFPFDYDTPEVMAPTDITSTVVMWLDHQGNKTKELSYFNLLDPHRIGFDSLVTNEEGAYDWVHGNAVSIDGDGLLLSSRHQDAVFRVNADGELHWLLSQSGGWSESFQEKRLRPVGKPFDFTFHQHAPERHGNTLLVFDNGNMGKNPYMNRSTPRPTSRVVAYEIDEEALTVSELWSLNELPDGTIFNPSQGDADWQPTTGNVLATYSNCVWMGDADTEKRQIRVVEFHPDDLETMIFDLHIFAPTGLSAYRSERISQPYSEASGLTRHQAYGG